MISIILGAGFSYVGGVPLAMDLFSSRPEVDRVIRLRLVERVLSGWKDWAARTGGTPEEYLSVLETRGGRVWHDAVWFVSLAIALPMGRVEPIGANLTITRHNIARTSGIAAHESFWSEVFRRTSNIAVITTNYDILAERGLWHEPHPRALRSGFNYGRGKESLSGGGFPSFSHIRDITASGNCPLYKLHGSISWSVQNGQLTKYIDCRPAIRGDAAILAPVTTKVILSFLRPYWEGAARSLSASKVWLIVGYSLPSYDKAMRDLLTENGEHRPLLHILDPDEMVVAKFTLLLPGSKVISHPGLPEGVNHIEAIVNDSF